jgi:hypothetical protein
MRSIANDDEKLKDWADFEFKEQNDGKEINHESLYEVACTIAQKFDI